MCGIHGFVNTSTKENNSDDFMRSGFVANSLRGMDSSGVALINTVNKELDYQKLPVNGSTFITDKYADNLIRGTRSEKTIAIGHNRAATTGKVGYSSAHPFIVTNNTRDFIGVHNGTLTYWTTKPEASKYSVDSEWALNHIFDKGLEAFKDFTGAYCFVWWDSDDSDTLNIALNSERPMHAVFTEDGNMAYASEPGMLYWLCERHNIKMKGPVIKLQDNKWYKFPVNKPSEFKSEDLPKTATTVYTGGSTTSTYYNRYSAKSHVEKVEELLAGIAAASTSQPDATVVTKKPSVSPTEIQNARDLMIMSHRVPFVPYWDDEESGEIYGCATMTDGTEMDAIIRNCLDLEFNKDDTWVCSVIGVMDDGKDIKVICGRPTITKIVSAAVN